MSGSTHALSAASLGASTRKPADADLGGLFRRAVAGIVTWYARSRERAQLAGMDARALADIGITRADALGEIKKPFWRA